MSLSVTVLGSAAMFATRERACSGYLVEADGTRIWMDAGSGTWRNLLGHIDFDSIDSIVLTHRHPDHTSDIFQCFHARRYGASEPLPRIPLFAPAETIERVVSFSPELDEAFDIQRVADGESVKVGDVGLSFVSMVHPAETLGVRVEHDGSAFGYSADSGPEADFEALAGGAALLVCEATFQDSDPEWNGHMRASQAGGVASDLGVGELVLTHLPPNRDLALSLSEAERNASTATVRLAADGMRLDL